MVTPKLSLKFLKIKPVLFEIPYLCEKNKGSFIKIGKVLPELFHFQKPGDVNQTQSNSIDDRIDRTQSNSIEVIGRINRNQLN